MAHREFTTAHVLCRVVLMAGRMVTEWMNDFVVGWKSCFLREMRGIRRGFRCLSLWGCGCSQDSRPAHAYREQMRHPWFVVVSEEDATVFQGAEIGLWGGCFIGNEWCFFNIPHSQCNKNTFQDAFILSDQSTRVRCCPGCNDQIILDVQGNRIYMKGYIFYIWYFIINVLYSSA